MFKWDFLDPESEFLSDVINKLKVHSRLNIFFVWTFSSIHFPQVKSRFFWALIKLHCICKLHHLSKHYLPWDCRSGFYSYMTMAGHVVSVSLMSFDYTGNVFCVICTYFNRIMIQYFVLTLKNWWVLRKCYPLLKSLRNVHRKIFTARWTESMHQSLSVVSFG